MYALFLGAVVGLEEISYIVSEDVGVVQVCVVVFPNVNCSDCLIKFAFEVYLSTLIGSAGEYVLLYIQT